MNQGEYEALMADETKRVDGDISWVEDEDHSPALHFRAEIASETGYPLFAKGYLNRVSRKLTYSLIHPGRGGYTRLTSAGITRTPTVSVSARSTSIVGPRAWSE